RQTASRRAADPCARSYGQERKPKNKSASLRSVPRRRPRPNGSAPRKLQRRSALPTKPIAKLRQRARLPSAASRGRSAKRKRTLRPKRRAEKPPTRRMKSLRRRAAADTNELHPSSEENRVALSTEVLEQEREALRTNLREIEDEQRTIEASLKIV